MLDYEDFKYTVAKRFKEFLPEQFQDMEIQLSKVDKVNRTMDAISLLNTQVEKSISPILYIDDMYEHYLDTKNLDAVLQTAADRFNAAFSVMPENSPFQNGNAQGNIIFQLINTAQNERMLKDAPHREFLDLSIIYRWVISINEESMQSIMIHNKLAQQLGMNEEQLFKCAMKNTRRLLPPEIKSMNDILREVFEENELAGSAPFIIFPDTSEDKMIWVISNDKRNMGAASILYDECLHKSAMNLQSNLYVLPSSIHECIVVSDKIGSPDMLAEMVNDINMAEVELEDRLSNHVYHYDKDARKLAIAANHPNTGLGSITEDAKYI